MDKLLIITKKIKEAWIVKDNPRKKEEVESWKGGEQRGSSILVGDQLSNDVVSEFVTRQPYSTSTKRGLLKGRI
jgi:subtilase family serine protease